MKPLRLLPVVVALSLIACKPTDTGPADATTTAEPAPSTAQAPARASLPAPPPSHWQCGDLRVTTRFEDAALNAMTLMMSGRKLPLQAVATDAGARFADSTGNEFWSRPGNVTLTLAGRGPAVCIKSKTPSPWVDATLRGKVWRLAGSEPGWFAEIGVGDTPAIEASLDNGARQVSLGQAHRVSAEDLTFEGRAANGSTVTVVIERTSCADSMSGEEFEATGKLTVAGQTYRGCAASLLE